MSIPLNVVANLLREAIVRPKERFEKIKRSTANFVFAPILPLFFFGLTVLGTLAVVSTGTTSTETAEIFKLTLSAASGMFYSVCGLAVVVLVLTIAANFAYTLRAERSLEDIRRLEAEEARRRIFGAVRKRLLAIVNGGPDVEIARLLSYAVRLYPDMIASDEELTSVLVSRGLSALPLIDDPKPPQVLLPSSQQP